MRRSLRGWWLRVVNEGAASVEGIIESAMARFKMKAYTDAVKVGMLLINSVSMKVDRGLTVDQAVVKTLNEYEDELNWDPVGIRDDLWKVRHLINRTLRMLYARHPEMPRIVMDRWLPSVLVHLLLNSISVDQIQERETRDFPYV